MGAEVIGVPGANGRGGPPITIPAGSFSTNLGLHGPEINIRAIAAITTKAASIGQLILLTSTSPPLNRHSNRPRQARFLLLPQCCLPTPLPSPAASLISRMKGKEGKAPEHLVPLRRRRGRSLHRCRHTRVPRHYPRDPILPTTRTRERFARKSRWVIRCDRSSPPPIARLKFAGRRLRCARSAIHRNL